jgi:hypothetical protein
VRDSASCICDAGYVREEATKCVDVNECESENGGCDPLTVCTNTPGGRSCGDCPAGYTGNGEDGCAPVPCPGVPDATCPCIRVTPDGDDALAAESHGRIPFRNVQPAIDFADENPNLATNVCVAAGADCDARASFAGPTGTDLRMRNGISLYGSYEATGWTRCAPITTTLVPETADGVVFAADVEDSTVLDGFSIDRLSAETTTGVTVDGARSVRLAGLTIVGALDPVNVFGVRLSGGASASLSRISVPDFLDGPVVATGLAIGVRAEASVVVIENTGVSLRVTGNGTAYGVWLDDAGSSRIVNAGLRAISVDQAQSGSLTTGIRVRGGESLEVSGGSVDFGTDAGMFEGYGIDATDAGHVAVNGTRLTARTIESRITGVRVLRTRLTLGETSELAINDRAGHATGVLLREAPASVVRGRVSVHGNLTSIGLALEGDASASAISGDIEASGSLEVVGVSMIDCAGAEPSLDASSVSASILGASAQGATTEGVRALGDCHPRLTNCAVTSRGRDSIRITGVRCGLSNGVSSRCSVEESSIALENTRTLPTVTTLAVGVSCEGGCRQIVGTTISGATQTASSSFRSSPNDAYGIVLDATSALVSGNTITAGCADFAAGIHAVDASSRIENNDASGLSCSNPLADHYVASAGLMVTGGALDVDSNVLRGGGSSNVVDPLTSACTSAGVMGGSGRYRNNLFGSGNCGVHYAFAGWRYRFTTPVGGGIPTELVNNGFDSSSTALYVDPVSGALTDISQVNALPLPLVGGNVLAAPP